MYLETEMTILTLGHGCVEKKRSIAGNPHCLGSRGDLSGFSDFGSAGATVFCRLLAAIRTYSCL